MSVRPKPRYPAVQPNPSFPAIEEEILEFWKQEKIFEESERLRPHKFTHGGRNEFVFYDGPPFPNGLPHYGPLITGFGKDLIPRYQTMRGPPVGRRFSWEFHALPAGFASE